MSKRSALLLLALYSFFSVHLEFAHDVYTKGSILDIIQMVLRAG